MTRCSCCGLYDGVHYKDCGAASRAAKEKLQAECDHRSEYGVTQTTGDPPGPRCCGRCGLELSMEPDCDYGAVGAGRYRALNELRRSQTPARLSPRGPTPHLPARWDGEVRVSIPAQELADLAERHRAKAAEYEAGGNAAGAAQLRAVQNWLWALLRGGDPGTILP